MTIKTRLDIGWYAFWNISLVVIYYSIRAVWKVGFFVGYWLSTGVLAIAALLVAGVTFLGASFVNAIIYLFERCLKSR